MDRKRRFNVRNTTDDDTLNKYSGLSVFKKSKQPCNINDVIEKKSTMRASQEENKNNMQSILQQPTVLENKPPNVSNKINPPMVTTNTYSMVTNNIPKVSSNIPKVSSNIPKVSSNIPKVSSNISKVSSNIPKVSSNISKVSSNIPKVSSNIPKVSTNTNCIFVNPVQRGNAVLKYVINVPWEYKDIIPDYEMGETTCAFYLSLRYHNLNPDYIHNRLKQLGNRYNLRVLLVHVDIINSKSSLSELARFCMFSNMTFILAWSLEEAGRYLETYKSYEFKSADILMEPVEKDFMKKMQTVLTSVKSINKTDAITLYSAFGSFKNIVNADANELNRCPGFGPQKVSRLTSVLQKPFKRAHTASRSIITPKKENKQAENQIKESGEENSQILKASEYRKHKEDLKINDVIENLDNNDVIGTIDLNKSDDEIQDYEYLRNSLAVAKEKLINKNDDTTQTIAAQPNLLKQSFPLKDQISNNSQNERSARTNNSLSFAEKVRRTKEIRDNKTTEVTAENKASQTLSTRKKTALANTKLKKSRNNFSKLSNCDNELKQPAKLSISNTIVKKAAPNLLSKSSTETMTVLSPTVKEKTTELSQEEYEELLADDDTDEEDLWYFKPLKNLRVRK